MGGREKLDAPGLASNWRALILRLVFVLNSFLLAGAAAGQCDTSPSQQIDRIRQQFDQQRWQEVVDLTPSAGPRSADLDFYYGSALAHLGRWQEAHNVLAAGAQCLPGDKRFPIELAGIAFQQKRYPLAKRYLRRALHLDPADSYGNDFLATVYFLQGNLEAALKYWNRVNKPQIVELRTDPTPKLNPALLDRAFIFAPASQLRLPNLLTSEERVRGLGIFPSYRFDLQARADERLDLRFRSRERNGWGQTPWEKLFLLFHGLPFQSINPEVYNLRRQAMNLIALYRWDAEKRRLRAELSAPFRANPRFRYGLFVDLRSENWDIRNSFQGPAPVLASLNLRREAVGANFSSFESGRWQWSAGGEVSHRDFRGVSPGTVLTPSLLTKGYQLKQWARLDATLWRFPERRLTLEGGLSSEAGRIWSTPSHSFEKLQGTARLRWFPQAEGDDYEMQHSVRAGKTFGQVPFDELFTLGLERDNDLWMRGHIGTRSGRKGSAPLGGNYFLSNLEADKKVYGNGIFTLKLGPFLDTGKITDASGGLGSRKWLWDIGVQAKVRVSGVGVVLSYGKDLRSGNNAVYVSMPR